MPIIPDVQSLGASPIPRRARGIVSDQSGEIAGASLAQFGSAIGNIAEKIDENGQELARAKDANNYLDHQVAVKQLEQTYKEKIAAGEVPYEEAQAKFSEDAAKIPAPTPLSRGPLAAENLNRGIARNIQGATFGVGESVNAARDKDLQSQGVLQLDSLGKLAGLPEANIDSVNKQADLVAPLLRRSGLSEVQVTRTLQDFKDKNWLNQATQRTMQSRQSLPELKQLEHDLTAADGFYAGKLDTDKRNAVLNQVITHRIQLENRLQINADRRDAQGERALAQIDQQIASGVPATAEMWSDWGQTIQGTSSAPQFQERQDDEREVQGVLRQPVEQQIKFVQDKEQSLLSEGGTLREHANLARMKSAVQANVKQMQEAPLLFNASRTGTDVQPLQSLEGPDAQAEIDHRMVTLAAMRKQYGANIPIRPLLPQEVDTLKASLDKATPKDQAETFGHLRQSFGDDEAYRGVMQQIAPDAPVKAMAGMLSAKQAQLTTQTHWFKPDEIAHSGDVAATLLQGEALLDPTKGQKSEDGKPKLNLYLPETKTLQADFQDQIGNAFAGRQGAAEVAFQAVKAYYVGRAVQTGRLAANSTDIDSGLVKEAITATLGTVSSFNGQGQVLAPWGMDKSTFADRAHQSFLDESKRRGISLEVANSLASHVGLRNAGDGTYYVTQGRNFLYDAHHQPIVITVQ